MPEIQLPMRTAYVMEFIPKGGRKARVELVKEVVPVLVDEVEDLLPALVDNGTGNARLFVRDGMLYEDAGVQTGPEATTVEAFSLAMRGNGGDLKNHVWFHDRTLGAEAVKSWNVFSGMRRAEVDAKEIIRDERLHGLATAQARGDRFVVQNGIVYRRPEGPPVMVAYLAEGSVSVRPSYRFANATSVGSEHRSFRYGDVEGILDFAERHGASRDGLRAEVEAIADVTWTSEGLAAEDTAAWWVLATASNLSRYPGEDHKDAGFMGADASVIRKLMDLRELADDGDVLLPSAEAAVRAAGVAGILSEMAGMRSLAQKPNFRRLCAFVAEEYRHSAMARDLEGMTLEVPAA